MKRTGEFGKLPAHLRRSAVLDAATRQFATSGRAGTSIDDIAVEAGVRKPAIYELFGSKDDLFRACVDQAVQALRDSFRVVNAETAELERPERTGPAELTGVRVVAAGRYRSYCHQL
jgi:AcrR family transcriptional regulator